MKKEQLFRGVVPPVVTPLNASEDVDPAGLREVLEYVVDAGMILRRTGPPGRPLADWSFSRNTMR